MSVLETLAREFDELANEVERCDPSSASSLQYAAGRLRDVAHEQRMPRPYELLDNAAAADGVAAVRCERRCVSLEVIGTEGHLRTVWRRGWCLAGADDCEHAGVCLEKRLSQ